MGGQRDSALMLLVAWIAATVAFGGGVAAVLVGGFAPGGPALGVSAIGAVLLTASRFAIPRLRTRFIEAMYSAPSPALVRIDSSRTYPVGQVAISTAVAAAVLVFILFGLVMSGHYGPYWPSLPVLVGVFAFACSAGALGRRVRRLQDECRFSDAEPVTAAPLGLSATQLVPGESVTAWIPVHFNQLVDGRLWALPEPAMAALTQQRIIVDDGRTEFSFWWNGVSKVVDCTHGWRLEYEVGHPLFIAGGPSLTGYIGAMAPVPISK